MILALDIFIISKKGEMGHFIDWIVFLLIIGNSCNYPLKLILKFYNSKLLLYHKYRYTKSIIYDMLKPMTHLEMREKKKEEEKDI